MSVFKDTEQVLYQYQNLLKSKVNLQNRIDYLKGKGTPQDIKGIDYSSKLPSYNDTKSFDDAYSDAIELIKAQSELKDTITEIEVIEKALNGLTESNKEILLDWYVNKLSKEAIAEKIEKYSTKSVYSLRNHAVADFAVLYFGVKGMAI